MTIQNDKMANVILRRKPKDLYGILLRQPANQNDNAVVTLHFDFYILNLKCHDH